MSTVFRSRWIWLVVPVLALALLLWPEETLVEEASASADSTAPSSMETMNTTGTTEEPSTVEEPQPAAESETGGGAKNVVQVHNRSSQRLRVRGNIQLNRIPGPSVAPENIAIAYASCTDCQTIAVALQIDLISRSASYVSPRNAAVAANANCTRCYTVARAIQYVYSVDDPTVVPQEVRDLIREMDQELHAIHSEQVSLPEAEARIDAVIGRFHTLASSLRQERVTTTEYNTPGATPPPAE